MGQGEVVMKFSKGVGILCALAATAASVPANAGCWAEAEASAAQVRELQTLLMVSTLRCAAAGINIAPEYNRFVASARVPLQDANATIKRHFSGGEDDSGYDRFTTTLANHYGAGATTAGTCAEAAALSQEVAANPQALADMARRRISAQALPGGFCQAHAAGVTLASADASAPALPASAPTAGVQTAAAITNAATQGAMPADVAAALAVVAGYLAKQQSPAAPTVLASATPAP
jgi:hypothetical protein